MLYRNQRFIKSVIDPVKAVNTYYRGATDSHIELELGNIQSLPAEVLGLTYSDTVELQPVGPTIVSPRLLYYVDPLIDCRLRSRDTVDFQTVEFAIPQNFTWSEEMVGGLRISYRILGTGQIKEEAVIPWPALGDEFIKTDLFLEEPNIDTFDFLDTSDEDRIIRALPGKWQIDRNLIIPQGYQVMVTGGTELNLSNGAKILSYSPLRFIGEEENPIVIQSKDSTGQGLVVMEVKEPSVFQHVTFQNLSGPSQSGWELSGSVTFYESPVGIADSQFIGSKSEDALNIVRSEFSIERTIFNNSFSDAIDSDFSKGRITDSSFLNSGNDAIDASGSVIEVSGVTIDGAGDKGLSAGEKSHIVAENVVIRDGWIGIASKDLSQVIVRSLEIINGEYGLAAYQKKSEFGPGSMNVSGLEIVNSTYPYLVEVESSLIVDKQVIGADQENVYQRLYEPE